MRFHAMVAAIAAVPTISLAQSAHRRPESHAAVGTSAGSRSTAAVRNAKGMILHDRGMDMAETPLERGGEEKLRELAESIIGEQKRETVRMKAWLDKHGR